MSTFVITKHVILTLSVEADSEEEAETVAGDTCSLDDWEYVDMTAQWVEKVGE